MIIFMPVRVRAVLSVAALLTLLGPLSSCGGASPSSARAEADLTALIARYDSAWSAKDIATVGQLMAASYTYVTSSGRLSPRTASLGFLSDTSYVLTSSRRSDVQITIVGTTARVISRWQGTGRFQGQPVLDDQTCGQNWIVHEGRWQLLTEYCVNRSR